MIGSWVLTALLMVVAVRGILGFIADFEAWHRGVFTRKMFKWLRRMYRPKHFPRI